MSRYSNWQNALFPQLQSLSQSPFASQFYNQNLQQNLRAGSQIAGRTGSNALLNFQRSGIGGGSVASGARTSLLNQIGRYGGGMQYQGFQGAANQANSDRWNAMSMGSNLFQPLNTGSSATSGGQFGSNTTNSTLSNFLNNYFGSSQQSGSSATNAKSNTTQTQSGLGTWLPQVLGGGLGLLSGFMGGFGGGSGQTSGAFQGTNFSQPIGNALNSANAGVIGGMNTYMPYSPGASMQYNPGMFNPQSTQLQGP